MFSTAPECSKATSTPTSIGTWRSCAAAHAGQVEHRVTWARTTSLATSTLSRWTDLLEISYQLVRVPAFSVNRTKLLAKSPKVF
jgi:predicted AAA+ superfamily ATPase